MPLTLIPLYIYVFAYCISSEADKLLMKVQLLCSEFNNQKVQHLKLLKYGETIIQEDSTNPMRYKDMNPGKFKDTNPVKHKSIVTLQKFKRECEAFEEKLNMRHLFLKEVLIIYKV